MKAFYLILVLAVSCSHALKEEDLYEPWPGCPNEEQGPDDDNKLEVADDCNQFIHCESFGKPALKSCAPSNPPLVFDSKSGQCVWPWESKRKCAGAPHPPKPSYPSNMCCGDDCGCVKFAHPDDCNKYLECCPKAHDCPPGMHFNPKFGECDHPKNVDCKVNTCKPT